MGSLVKLQERLASDLKSLESNVSEVLDRRTAEVMKLVAAPLRKVHAITEQMQTLDVHFGGLRGGIKDHGLVMPTAQDIRDAECRLVHKMTMILGKLDRIESAERNKIKPRKSASLK